MFDDLVPPEDMDLRPPSALALLFLPAGTTLLLCALLLDHPVLRGAASVLLLVAAAFGTVGSLMEYDRAKRYAARAFPRRGGA